MDLLKIMSAGSVDDGKSTLIGRLFHDYGQIHEDNLESLSRHGLNLAHFTDGLSEERLRGITIDVAYKYLETAKRKFIIADCPGHKEFTRNMVTGATSADLVLILVDAERGVTEQTWRHTSIVKWLGKEAVYLLNKMDVSGYQQKTFESFQEKLSDFPIIPISALLGDNVITRSSNMHWYKGHTLDELIHSFKPGKESPEDQQCFFSVQYACERSALGTLTAGKLHRGDKLKCHNPARELFIENIFRMESEVTEGYPGEPLRLSLSSETKRGDVLFPCGSPLAEGTKWEIEWCQLLPFSNNLVLRYFHDEFPVHEIIPLEVFNLENQKWIRFEGQVLTNHIYRGHLCLKNPLLLGPEPQAAIFDLHNGATAGAVLIKEIYS